MELGSQDTLAQMKELESNQEECPESVYDDRENLISQKIEILFPGATNSLSAMLDPDTDKTVTDFKRNTDIKSNGTGELQSSICKNDHHELCHTPLNELKGSCKALSVKTITIRYHASNLNRGLSRSRKATEDTLLICVYKSNI